MKSIIINEKPAALNEIGGRSNNEDAIYPPIGKAEGNERIFMVCDGVGGANKGETASYLTCKTISEFLQNKTDIKPNDIKQAIAYTEQAFDDYISQKPECKGMATTLAMLLINDNNCTIAWAGDSRIYHIRNRNIIFQSKDHSLINYLIDTGEIKPEEANNHPKKNIILKALKGTEDPITPQIEIIENIMPDDLFLLCTDGVLENISNQDLKDICLPNKSEAEIKEEIFQRCQGNTKDNFSIYIIKIKQTINQKNTKLSPKIILIATIIIILIILFWAINMFS